MKDTIKNMKDPDCSEVFTQYNRFSEKQALQLAATDTSTDTTALSTKLKSIITGVLAKQQENFSSLKKSLELINSQEELVDVEGPRIIQDKILSDLDRLTFFPSGAGSS